MINVWFTSEGSQFFLDTLFIISFEYFSSALPSYFIPCTISPEINVVMFIGCFCGKFFLRFCKVNPNAKNTILHIDICSRHSCVIIEFHKSRFLFHYLYKYIRMTHGLFIFLKLWSCSFPVACSFILLWCDSNF